MKVLITGATGILGKHLYELIPESIGTWYTNSFHSKPLIHLDICNYQQVTYTVDLIKPNVIIHCAGIGNVEFAEKNYQETSKINVEATENLHKVAKDYGAQFVYISSNAVFDGSNPPYSEQSERHPINRYGSIKKQAEDVVMAGRDWLIFRPYMLYGWPYPNARSNWYTLVLSKLRNGEKLQLVNDVYWQPTNVLDCVKTIWQLIQQSETEQVYNLAPNEKPMTLFKFAKKIARIWDLNTELLEAVPSSHFEGIAKRPVNTQYDTSKIRKMGIKMLTVKRGLRALL